MRPANPFQMCSSRARLLIVRLLGAPALAWVLLAFFVSFLFFFIYPIFWSAGAMQFPIYVPAAHPVGADLKIFLHYITVWLAKGSQAVGPSPYPPVARLFFALLILVQPSIAYAVITLLSVLCYVLIAFALPLKMSTDKHFAAIPMFFFTTGLLSYGFQFELERGQFNVIAILFSFLAIWIYHYKPSLRYLAYILFTVSVQLKVYPFIFVIMLIHNWREWRHNIRRILGLALANAVLLLVLGPAALGDSLKGMTSQMADPYVWMGNHSIRSFVSLLGSYAAAHGWTGLQPYTRLLEAASVALVLLCVFSILLQAYRRNQQGLNSPLLVACTLAAMLLPAASQDYKLSILAAPCALLFCVEQFRRPDPDMTWQQRIVWPVLIFVFSAAYSTTLFSFTNKPSFLQNNFPALLAMLLSLTCLSLMFRPGAWPTADSNQEPRGRGIAVDVGAD